MTIADNQGEHIQAITILLAEDHEVVRNGIRSLLEKEAGLKVIAEAANGLDVLRSLEQGIKPDILLTDINMPGMSGIELLENLSKKEVDIKVIILSMLDNERSVIKAFKAGASGYLLKSVSALELVFALKHVAAGGEYACAEIAMRVMKRLVRVPEISAPANVAIPELAARDLEVLELVAEGYTNQEIADKLFTSKRTVEGYRQHLMNTTGSRNTAALIKFAILNGLLN